VKRAGFFQEYGVLVAFVLLFAVAAIRFPDSFLHADNLRNLLSQNAYVGIIAIGMTFVIISGGIDLSVGSLVALCGAAAVLSVNKVGDSGPFLVAALAAGLASGAIAGFANGAIVAFGRVAPFVVTLAGLAGFRSIALVLGQGGEIRSQVKAFGDFGYDGIPIPGLVNLGGKPVVLYWSTLSFLAVALLGGFLLNKTRYGRHVIAVGANEKAARYSGIDTRWVKVWTYTLLGALVGLAAFFNSARMNSVGTGSVGLYYELDAIAAVVIGGTSLAGGKGRIWGTVVGVLLLTLIGMLLNLYKVDPNWQGAVRGAVILVAVLLQRSTKPEN
jgi:ribose transport system permease protein